jgi:hypothetical protein
MNLIICKKDGTVFREIKNAIRKGKHIEGDNGSWVGKPELFDLIWTEQELTPVFEEDEKGQERQVGYKETFADIAPLAPPRDREQPEKLTRGQRIAMLERLEDFSDKDFVGIDKHTDEKAVTLSEVKQFMKLQAKATLAIIKLLQDTMR